MSKIQDMEVRLPGDPQYFKLLPSPSVDLEADPECLPLLSVVSGESTSSLATYVNVLPPYSAVRGHDFDEAIGRKYFEVKLDSSSGECPVLKKKRHIQGLKILYHTRKFCTDTSILIYNNIFNI